MKPKHTLFGNEMFDGIQWSITQDKVKRFVELWDDGLAANEIAATLKFSTTQVALMVIDLGSLGKIKQRKNGFFG